jgi:branched-chain amino acid transport system substrate-binding protein
VIFPDGPVVRASRRVGAIPRLLGLAAAIVLLVAGVAWPQGPGRGPSPGATSREPRLALVIGNAGYAPPANLKNPVNDAQDVAQALRPLGFDVILQTDADLRSMQRGVREFQARLAAGGVGLFYYAGHGMQVRGNNYLIPVEAKISTEAELDDEALDVNRVLRVLDESRSRVSVVVLDACRDNPFSRGFRSVTRGLAVVSAPSGSFIAYATSPGSVAADGSGRNGLFTAELLRAMRTPGLDIVDVFRQVIGRVRESTNGRQVPWTLSSLDGYFYFALPGGGATGARPDDQRLEAERRQLEEERRNLEQARQALEQEKRLREERERVETERQRLEEERRRLAATPPPSAPAPARGVVVKIVTHSPLSGGQAALGEALKLGATLAVEKLKGPLERQGFRVEIIPFDDQAKPDVGVANARNIVADPAILAVIGHLNSGVAIPASEVYRQVNLAMISPANTNPNVTDRGYANVFRVCGRDDAQGIAAADFAYETLGARSAYIVHDRTSYGQGVAEVFKARVERKGVRVVGFEGTEDKRGFASIGAIRTARPDLVYFGGIYDQAAAFIREARDAGVRAAFLGPDGFDSSDLVKLGGRAVVGTYYTMLAFPLSSYPRQFVDDYRQRFGKQPEWYAAEAYDAATVALKAIEAVVGAGRNPTREAVTAAVSAVRHVGITGPIEFDGKGDQRRATYSVLQVAGENPQSWGENREVKRLSIAPPASRP